MRLELYCQEVRLARSPLEFWEPRPDEGLVGSGVDQCFSVPQPLQPEGPPWLSPVGIKHVLDRPLWLVFVSKFLFAFRFFRSLKLGPRQDSCRAAVEKRQ